MTSLTRKSFWLSLYIHHFRASMTNYLRWQWKDSYLKNGSKRPISQIPQCMRQMSHNAPFCNRNVHTCTFLLQNDALWDMGLLHCGIWDWCIMGFVKWVNCTSAGPYMSNIRWNGSPFITWNIHTYYWYTRCCIICINDINIYFKRYAYKFYEANRV